MSVKKAIAIAADFADNTLTTDENARYWLLRNASAALSTAASELHRWAPRWHEPITACNDLLNGAA